MRKPQKAVNRPLVGCPPAPNAVRKVRPALPVEAQSDSKIGRNIGRLHAGNGDSLLRKVFQKQAGTDAIALNTLSPQAALNQKVLELGEIKVEL